MTKLVSIPHGETRTLDQIQIERDIPRDYGVIDSLRDSFEIVKTHPTETIASLFLVAVGYFVVYFFVYILIAIGMLFGVGMGALLREVNETFAQIAVIGVAGVVGAIYIAAMLLMIVAQAVAIGAYTICILRVIRGEKVDLAKDFKTLKYFIKPLAITSLWFTLAIFLGMLGFVVGAYVVMIGCIFAQVLVVDKNISGMDALKASWHLTRGHKMNLLGFFFLANLLNMAGMLACGIGFIFTIPMTMVAMLTIYDALVEPGNFYDVQKTSADVFS